MNNIAERTDAVSGFPVSPAGPATDPSVSTGQYPAPVAATRYGKPTSGSAAGFTTDVGKNKIRKRLATENFGASVDGTYAPKLRFTRRIRSEKSVVFDVSEKPRSADELDGRVWRLIVHWGHWHFSA
jgi:hypothetical protein